jgi:hypothetical protein
LHWFGSSLDKKSTEQTDNSFSLAASVGCRPSFSFARTARVFDWKEKKGLKHAMIVGQKVSSLLSLPYALLPTIPRRDPVRHGLEPRAQRANQEKEKDSRDDNKMYR